MDREELQRMNLASSRQPAHGHPSVVQWNRIASPRDLRSHPADDEVLTLYNEHEGGAALDGRKVRERERDGNQRTGAESQSNLASHTIPDIVLGVLP